MSELEKNKETVTQFYEQIWNEGNTSLIPQLMDENVSFRGSLGQVQHGHKGFVTYMNFVHRALENYQSKIVDLVAEGDKVYARLHYSGKHKGELFGYAPTHAKIKWEGIAVFTFTGGKITDTWALGDVQSVTKQLSKYVMD